MAVGLTTLSTTALAQPVGSTASPYAPAVPESSVYRPAPVRPYALSPGAAAPSPSVTTDARPLVSTGDRFSREEVLTFSFIGLSLIILLTGGGIFWLLHKHEDGKDQGGKA
ncbi:MAG TPA: hypothetical protein VFX30_04525 [bacterium]|nr:hypothetical protein [bacterium]